MSILRVNRSKTKHCVLHNGMITWNSLPDIFKLNVSFSMFMSKVRNFYLEKYLKILMQGATMIAFFPLKFMQLRFFKCNCSWFWVFCCEISNYFFCGYNQDNQECYCQLDMYLASETSIVSLFQRNQYFYSDYFILIVFNQVRFRLRFECSGSLMSLYGPTFHVTPIDLCIIFQCNIYILYRVLCKYNCFKIVSNCFNCQCRHSRKNKTHQICLKQQIQFSFYMRFVSYDSHLC